MLSWVISSYIALAIGIMRLRKSEYEGWTDTVNWGWLGRGVVVIFPFLLSTLALRGLSTFDRYWFEKLNGLDILAAYIFTTTLLNSLISIHEAAVISFAYPRLIKAHVDGDALEFKKLMSSMLAATVVISVLYCGGLILVLPYLLKLVNHSEYLDNLQMVILIVISALLNIFGLIPHYALYAQGFDKSINISHGLGLLFFILSAIALSQFYTAIAIPLSLCIGFSTILFVNFYAFLKLSPAKYLTNCAHEI
jgi:O-antigen/teichoic acid export membrane protein